jgi:hypothetical protein
MREYVDRLGAAVSRTRTASAVTLRRRDARAVFAGVTALYLGLYLWAIGHLAPGLGGFDFVVVADPLGKFLQPQLGPYTFTPVARVSLGPLTYLLSFNTVVGAAVASLVGLNLGLTYLAWTQPAACGIREQTTGPLASLPALLSGTACCGPVVLFALGIQASATVLTAFELLLPAAILALVASLVLVGRQVEPAAVRGAS